MFSMNKMVRPIGLALMLAAIPIAGVQAQSRENTLRIAVGGDLSSVDPLWTDNLPTAWYARHIYETLFAYDENNRIQPQMVGDFSVSDDNLTYEFTLRPGLKFHDGEPVRSADVIASVNRWGQKDVMGRMMLGKAETFEAVDDDTFRLVLKEPFGLVLEAFAKSKNPANIMPESVAAAPATQEITETIGSGPFKFVREEWVPGSRVVFEKNEDYVPRDEPASALAGGKVVHFDRMEWLYIPDVNTKLTALSVGEVDFFDSPPLDFLPIFEAEPDVQAVFLDPLGTQVFLRPNHLHPPFDNPLARKALLHFVNQDDTMQAIVGDRPDLYIPFCGAYFICGAENETDVGSEPLRDNDVEEGKRLLAEAGYNGEPVVIMQPTDRPEHNAPTLVMIQALRDAGINLDVQAADWATISARRAQRQSPSEGGWNLFISATVASSSSDPLGLWFSPSCETASPGWPCDEEIQALTERWVETADPEKKRALIEEMQKRAYEEVVPYIPLGQYLRPHAARADLTGFLKRDTAFWNVRRQ